MPRREEGVRALWKGNGVTIIHRLPYSGANFWTYEQVNELWKSHVPPEAQLALGDVTRRLASGGVAGLTACTLVRTAAQPAAGVQPAAACSQRGPCGWVGVGAARSGAHVAGLGLGLFAAGPYGWAGPGCRPSSRRLQGLS